MRSVTVGNGAPGLAHLRLKTVWENILNYYHTRINQIINNNVSRGRKHTLSGHINPLTLLHLPLLITIVTRFPSIPAVTERLVQRVPLMAGAAGVCFVVGCVFGTLCAVTIGRGTSRRRTHKHRTRRRRREDVYITPPVQSQSDPNYAELSPVRVTTVASSSTASSASSTSSAGSTGSSNSASNSSSDASTTNMNSSVGGDQASGGSDGRRENDYTELGMPDIPQFHRPNGTTNSVGLREIATNVGDPCRDSSSGPPLPPRGQPTNCETCIDMDLDELERVVLQQ